ncbi:MAG: acyl--CoA ligase [Lachnospiraceae bacterium]|nr:acyl--CoA ligase [Lachnospiraceae bacterium]
MKKNVTGMSFRDLIEREAALSADKPLLYMGSRAFSLKEINDIADNMAQELSALGVKRGTHVGLCGTNTARWVAAFFAIQKLGAICVLMNPALLPKEIAEYSSIGEVTYLCCGKSRFSDDEEGYIEAIRQSEHNAVSYFYNIEKEIKGVEGGKESEFRPQPDDPAIMLFTSGSTARPKCALLSSYSVLVSATESMKSQLLTENDRTCLILPLFHVFGIVAGLFANILAGSVMYLPEDMHTATLIDTIERYECTVFHAVPTMMLMLISSKEFLPERLKSVRCTILSGAAATKEQIELFQKNLPNDHFLSAYGLSESAPVSTLPYGDTLENCITTVGKPMDHIKVRIVDIETGRDCMPGQKGEIIVKGVNLMTAYYKVRIEDQSIDGEGWLHTGDLGCLREDGYLCFLGRLKELIIRGGENIMPQDVAAAVSTLKQVKDVKVVAVPSDFYGEEVCACIILRPGTEFDSESAKKELKEKIAGFKIPSYFLIYEEFPVLATGKVDMVSLKKDAAALAFAAPEWNADSPCDTWQIDRKSSEC